MFGVGPPFRFNDAVGAEETFWAGGAPPPGRRWPRRLPNSSPKAPSTEGKAVELARLYLHDNAAKVVWRKEMSTPAKSKHLAWKKNVEARATQSPHRPRNAGRR